ncbi:MAG: alpha/beta hydrolase [Bdellovibrionota bacterium]
MTQTAEAQFVLIRGLAREARHWGNFPEVLEKTFAQAGHKIRVDAIDQPGCGRYSEMRSPISIHGITKFMRQKHAELRARIREQGEQPPAKTFVLAVSLGGMVTSDWIHHWPNDLTGAVFVNTSFRGFSPIHHRLTPRGVEHLVRIIAARNPESREREILKMVSNRPDLHDAIAETWTNVGLSRPVSLENFARQLFAAATYRAADEAPKVPVLLLNSEKDRMVSPGCSDAIASKWAVPLEKHVSGGHDLPLDDPEWTAEKTLSWFQSLSAAREKKSLGL